MTIKYTLKLISMAALMGAAISAFAEAPVYEVDQLDQDAPTQQSQRDVLPPAPTSPDDAPGSGSTQDMQSTASAAPSPAPSSSSSSSDINHRLDKIEQQVNDLSQNSSAAQVESLQSQIQTLRNQIEQLSHNLEKVQADQKTAYTDIDNRLAELSSASAHAASPAVAAVVPTKSSKKADDQAAKNDVVAKADTTTKSDSPDVAEEQQIYQTAYSLIKDKKYDDAVKTLQNMLKKYPSGQFASNAHYWLGELYGLLGKNDKSLGEFVIVVTKYNKSPRTSDAQLKIGQIFANQQKWSDAKSAFKKVIDKYPGTASARLASEQLKQLKSAGH